MKPRLKGQMKGSMVCWRLSKILREAQNSVNAQRILRQKGVRTFHPTESSPHGRFAPCMDISPHGRFAHRRFDPCPWLETSIEPSPRKLFASRDHDYDSELRQAYLPNCVLML